MGTHPIFESDFDCLTENERRAIVAPPCREIGFKLRKMQRCHETAKNCSGGNRATQN